MPKGKTESYTSNSFEEFYTRKLDAIKVQLKSVIYGALPFVVSQEYACKKCSGRIKLHADGWMYCLKCGEMPRNWSKQQQERVYEILRGYPDVDDAAKEWRPPKKAPSRAFTTEAVAFGAKVEEARQALGWSQEELATKIFKKDGENISRSTINMVEHGHQNCSLHIREQLERILGLREGVCLEA